jgi:DNA-binding NarL/FixJ family response regulator
MQDTQKYTILKTSELLKFDVPPREMLLSPWLSGESINLLYAWRGIGKTQMALGISYAIGTKTSFLGWEAPNAQKVLYVDGEMPIGELKNRISSMKHVSDNVKIFSSSIQNFSMPDLKTIEGQEALDALITEDTKLIIIDNLSCLVGGNENDAESWSNVGKWAIQKRSQGKSILFIHHAGKEGQQRGTSRKEDIMDCVITLKHPKDYDPSQGARFEVHFEKARCLSGAKIKPFIAGLESIDGKYCWTTVPILTAREKAVKTDKQTQEIIKLHEEGLTNVQIAEQLGVNRTLVWKKIKAHDKENNLDDDI